MKYRSNGVVAWEGNPGIAWPGNSHTLRLWELHGPAIPAFPEKSLSREWRQSFEIARKTFRVRISTEIAQKWGENNVLDPLFKCFFKQ